MSFGEREGWFLRGTISVMRRIIMVTRPVLTRKPDGRTRNGSRGGGGPEDPALTAGEECPDMI